MTMGTPFCRLFLTTPTNGNKTERVMFPGFVNCLMTNQGGTAGVPLVPLLDEGFFNEKMYAKERTP